MARKVLVVEDSEINRALLRNILKRDYDVLEAENGEEALMILHKKYKMISAVVLDIAMPVMDGFEVLRRVRSNTVLSQLPVIVATGSHDEEIEVKALSLGANDFVTKPYNPSILLHCLRNTINLRETASIVNAMQRDKLTGLYNRETFFDKVSVMIKDKPPGYYIMSCFDIDNFKLINDQYGAAEGDRIICHIGQVARTDILEIGGICSRISADNFAMLYPAGAEEMNFVAQMRDKKLLPQDTRATLSFSVGRYIVTDLTLPASTLYDRAFIAKRSVKGRYDSHVAYFDDSMLERLLSEQEIINEMDAALIQGQFEVWFQPQFNHDSGALIGTEALVRWRHPVRGLIPPNEFIPVFEQNGFIYELDKFVWKQTCVYLRKWLDEERSPLPVSVNVSRYDIFRADLMNVITGLIAEYDIPVELLRIEITESAFSKSTEQIIAVVKQLMGHGFVVEIDDFGSGYSSLNTLKDVPADILKLDMRFLETTDNSQRGGNILESIVRMAKWLDMAVIAEGVETYSQAEFLKSIGCSYVQGYLYARPLQSDEYEQLARIVNKEERLLSMETVENLDNNAFWDPNSMDTLIFNSYVGGACIFEYYNGEIELLRANDKYAQVIGMSDTSVEQALKLSWREHLDEKNLRMMTGALEQSVSSGDEVTEEFEFTGLPGCQPVTNLRLTMRVIASAGERYLVYCTNENITAQRQAEKMERLASEQLQAIMKDAGSGITAGIIENGGIRFILANDKFYELMGFTRTEYEAEVKDGFSLIHPEDRARVTRTIIEAYESEASAHFEYRIVRKTGEERWIQTVISPTRFTGMEQAIQLGVFTDITGEKQADYELRKTDSELRFLNDIAHDLLSQPDTEKGIEKTLGKLLDYFGGNRAYIFELDRGKKTSTNTYEVCAEGVTHEKERLRDIPFEAAPFWLHAFDGKQYIDIEDVDGLDDSRLEERAILAAQGIKSLIAVPLMRDGVLIGFIGIDDPLRQHSRIDRLVALGDYIAVMLTRRDLDAKIKSGSASMMALMDGIPGGFVRMKILGDGRVVPVYYNAGFERLCGMSPSQIAEVFGHDVFAGVHPDDVPMVREELDIMLSEGEVHSLRRRIRHGSEGYIWIVFFGSAVTDAAGNTFLNIYYTDESRQMSLEEERRELLDNLPCGAALFELDGEKISPIHLNKQYRTLVDREIVALPKATVLDVIHPDDRENILKELKLAMADPRDFSADIRLLHGAKGDYRIFRICGRTVLKEGGKCSVYATFTPISEEAAAYEEMLTVALSGVMDSSPDIAFVKDINFRYVCCSKPFAGAAGIADVKEVIGKTDHDLIDKALADKYRACDERIMATKTAMLGYDEIIPTWNGQVRFAVSSKYPLMDAGGNVIGIYGVTRDVTRAKTADMQLRFLTDTISGGLATYRCSPGSIRIMYFNDGFARLLGCTHEEYEEINETRPMSMIFDEDIPQLMEQLDAMLQSGASIEQVCRVHTKNGGMKWISYKAVAAERDGNEITVNTVLLDVTDLQESLERLRVSEEGRRLAVEHSGNAICRFNIAERTLTASRESMEMLGLPEVTENVPEGPVGAGLVSAATADAYTAFYKNIINGADSGRAVFQSLLPKKGWRWVNARSSTIFSASGAPLSAVVSFYDVSEELEKETVYKKWQQSLDERDPGSYTLLRCNLSKDLPLESVEGQLLDIRCVPQGATISKCAAEYAREKVLDEDAERYKAFLNSDALLAGYYRGTRAGVLEYREKQPDGDVRWIRLSADLIEHPNSTDVEAYLMYENIDDSKRAELLTIQRAETDPLTGILNRATFAERVDSIIKAGGDGTQHALLMLDIDGFKRVNDVFGHGAGDQALINAAGILGSMLRRNDLLGRLGGDEFVVFLNDIPNDSVAVKKADRICALMRKSFSAEVHISASIGMAVCPRDGLGFDTLYKKADAALYHIKGSGKDNYGFFRDGMCDHHLDICADTQDIDFSEKKAEKRRMLIVDDSSIDFELLRGLFKDDFIIEKTKDGASALIRLRHYGSAISVVLLDLMMPGMDGFTVLEKMRGSPELSTIPVVVVSSDGDLRTSLKAIRCGASDFVTKPVDPELLRIRVASAISKAENERLRAKNSFLEMQSCELDKYRTVLEHTGTVLIEHNWTKGTFSYDLSISAFIAGVWDDRGMWQILLSDMVADVQTVQDMQLLVLGTAENREEAKARMKVQLMTPAKTKHWFEMNVYRLMNEYQLTDRIVITLNDAEPAPDGDG